MIWCPSLSLFVKALTKKKNNNRGLFLSVFMSSIPSYKKKSQFWKRRSEPVSSQCTVMQQLHQRLLLCANVLHLFNVQLVCFPGWPIKSPSGMLMSSTLLLNIPQGLYELCVQQSRGSLVMGLTRLAENMMGVLMCWQVVLLNDGWADTVVECSPEWMRCGMTVWALHLLLQCSFSETANMPLSLFFLYYLLKVEAQNCLEFLTCTSQCLDAFPLLTILALESIIDMRKNGK